MSEEKRKFKNLSTYAVVMLLAMVLLIIIAAMADHREQHYENQIQQQEQTNLNFQNEIVKIKDENYNLKKELEQLKSEKESGEKNLTFYQSLQQAWALYGQGKEEEAREKIKNIPEDTLTQEQKEEIKVLQNLLY